jgi:hypothetical protein
VANGPDVHIGEGGSSGDTYNQHAINAPQAESLKTVYLDPTQTNAASVWTCPGIGIGGVSYSDAFLPPQWNIGYQYFGGIHWWMNASASGTPAASPIKLSTAKPSWVLASDLVCLNPSINSWADVTGPLNRVAHQRPHKPYPDGANHLTVDGSVNWIKMQNLLQITTFDTGTRLFYFYQNDLSSINPADLRYLKPPP